MDTGRGSSGSVQYVQTAVGVRVAVLIKKIISQSKKSVCSVLACLTLFIVIICALLVAFLFTHCTKAFA